MYLETENIPCPPAILAQLKASTPADKIALENGRWGAFIRFGKAMVKLGRNANGEKFTNEELVSLSLDEVKKMIEAELPDAFKKAAAKKAPAKKTAAKKTAAKKTVKKAVKK
jgi:DNA topoisomerase-1